MNQMIQFYSSSYLKSIYFL